MEGPLGKPSVIKNFGTVVIVGGGVGTALAYPTTVALKRAGNQIVTILGGRNRDLVILENEMRQVTIAVVDAQETEAALDAELKADKTAKNVGMRKRRAQAAKFP